jgi:hypothetical protein
VLKRARRKEERRSARFRKEKFKLVRTFVQRSERKYTRREGACPWSHSLNGDGSLSLSSPLSPVSSSRRSGPTIVTFSRLIRI